MTTSISEELNVTTSANKFNIIALNSLKPEYNLFAAKFGSSIPNLLTISTKLRPKNFIN